MANPAKAAAVASDADHTLVVTRVFDAPRDAVFKAWIDPAQMSKWMGPRSIKADVLALDARPGGSYRIAMHGESGIVNTVGGTYREVAPPDRLVFTWTWEKTMEKNGVTTPGGHEMTVTITFRAKGRQTEMTLHQARFATTQSRDSHNEGWTGSFDKLADLLAGNPTGR